MITIHILQFLIDNLDGLNAIDTDCWFENMPLDKYGLLIVSTSGIKSRGVRTASQNFDLYYRHDKSNVVAVKMLEDIVQLLSASYGNACTLPAVPKYSDRTYSRVVFDSITTIENLGENSNGRVLFRIGARVIFNKEQS